MQVVPYTHVIYTNYLPNKSICGLEMGSSRSHKN